MSLENRLHVSGLPYVRHEAWFKLNIAPMRATIEHQLGLVFELQAVGRAATATPLPLTVCMDNSDDTSSAAYEFACAMLRHYDTRKVEDGNECDVVYVLPQSTSLCTPPTSKYVITSYCV